VKIVHLIFVKKTYLFLYFAKLHKKLEIPIFFRTFAGQNYTIWNKKIIN